MNAPSDIQRDATRVLGEIPLAFVQLHTAVTGGKIRGTGERVSGGTRDFVPINTAADAQKSDLLEVVRAVHREVAECFGEPRSRTVGIQSACDDLTRWSSVWSWHPYAERWFDHLSTALHDAQRISGHTEWVAKSGTVCPVCLGTGCLEVNEETGDHRCTRSGTEWTGEDYIRAVVHAAQSLVDRGIERSNTVPGYRSAA